MEDETSTEETTHEENKPEPEHHATPHHYDDAPVRAAIDELKTKVEELSETVSTVVAGQGDRDSTPVKKPWTHWGSK